MKDEKKRYGMVCLVGAGPGDPRLITVRGRELLKACDAVVYDHLASQELLSETREDCERILALYCKLKGLTENEKAK